jgi:hypothetical protein
MQDDDTFAEFEEQPQMWVRLPRGQKLQIPRNPSDDIIDVLSGIDGSDLRKNARFMHAIGRAGGGSPGVRLMAQQASARPAEAPQVDVNEFRRDLGLESPVESRPTEAPQVDVEEFMKIYGPEAAAQAQQWPLTLDPSGITSGIDPYVLGVIRDAAKLRE